MDAFQPLQHFVAGQLHAAPGRVSFGENGAPSGVRMEHRACPARSNDSEMDCGLIRWLVFAANNLFLIVYLQNLGRYEAALVDSTGRDRQAQGILMNNCAEVPTGPQDPTSRIETPAYPCNFASYRAMKYTGPLFRVIVSRGYVFHKKASYRALAAHTSRAW